jgi:hypothetical protein
VILGRLWGSPQERLRRRFDPNKCKGLALWGGLAQAQHAGRAFPDLDGVAAGQAIGRQLAQPGPLFGLQPFRERRLTRRVQAIEHQFQPTAPRVQATR